MQGGGTEENEDDGGTALRLDKWLWFARLAKTRSLAQRLVTDGRVRVNRERAIKPSQKIGPGDLVSVRIGERLRLLKVAALGERRGPAQEAAGLFVDLAPQLPKNSAGTSGTASSTSKEHGSPPTRDAGAGRPTKRERRKLDRLQNS